MKTLCASAMLVASFSSNAVADENSIHCDVPMSLAGIEVSEEGTVFHFYDGGGEIYKTTPGMPLMPEDVVEFQDLVENGIMSQGIADFLNSSLMPILNNTEDAHVALGNRFDEYMFFTSGKSTTMKASYINAEGAWMGYVGNAVSHELNVSDISNALEKMMTKYNTIDKACGVGTLSLVNDRLTP